MVATQDLTESVEHRAVNLVDSSVRAGSSPAQGTFVVNSWKKSDSVSAHTPTQISKTFLLLS